MSRIMNKFLNINNYNTIISIKPTRINQLREINLFSKQILQLVIKFKH